MFLPEKTAFYNDGMTWLVNGREFANVMRMEPSARYEYFVKRVADWQELWGLWKDGWAMMGDSDGGELVPVWPHSIYAEALAHGDWLGYTPKNISLSDWMDKWIPGMIRENQRVAVFPVIEGPTSTAAPLRLKQDLEEELDKME